MKMLRYCYHYSSICIRNFSYIVRKVDNKQNGTVEMLNELQVSDPLVHMFSLTTPAAGVKKVKSNPL
jgi:hypothetical protein